MGSIFDGKKIHFIRQNGGTVAGEPMTIDIHMDGGVLTVTDPKEIELINGIIKETQGTSFDAMDYLRFILKECYDW